MQDFYDGVCRLISYEINIKYGERLNGERHDVKFDKAVSQDSDYFHKRPF